MTAKQFIPIKRIEKSILLVRSQKVMLDSDLAKLYGVTTKRLNEQVRRNRERFPNDFMFQLSWDELESLRSQIATLKKDGSNRGRHKKYLPYVFTEHGAIMLASVLNSPTAVQASIQVVRAFIKLREFALTNQQLTQRLNELEKKYDDRFKVIFEAIKQLMLPPKKKKNPIGFQPKNS